MSLFEQSIYIVLLALINESYHIRCIRRILLKHRTVKNKTKKRILNNEGT